VIDSRDQRRSSKQEITGEGRELHEEELRNFLFFSKYYDDKEV
jgi:hypothetical protein